MDFARIAEGEINPIVENTAGEAAGTIEALQPQKAAVLKQAQ